MHPHKYQNPVPSEVSNAKDKTFGSSPSPTMNAAST